MVESVICRKCGSEFLINDFKIPLKDTSSEWCSICGEVLKSWRKSTTIYNSKLITKREKHLKAAE